MLRLSALQDALLIAGTDESLDGCVAWEDDVSSGLAQFLYKGQLQASHLPRQRAPLIPKE